MISFKTKHDNRNNTKFNHIHIAYNHMRLCMLICHALCVLVSRRLPENQERSDQISDEKSQRYNDEMEWIR